MRGADITQEELFSVRTLEERIPKDHPLRKLRAVVDVLLRTMDSDLAVLSAKTGRDSIPPERLLRASLLQVLYAVRSERQRVEQIEFNLLYRWFVGLTLDAAVWDHSTFSANRDRLLNTRISRLFFDRVGLLAEWRQLLSDEHFSVECPLMEAWASMKSFVRKEGTSPPPEDGGRNPTVNFKGETRANDTPASTSGPDARLYKKKPGDKSYLCFMRHALMENRQGGGRCGGHPRDGHRGAGSDEDHDRPHHPPAGCDGRGGQSVRCSGIRGGPTAASGHAACRAEGQGLGDRWAHHPSCRLSHQFEDP